MSASPAKLNICSADSSNLAAGRIVRSTVADDGVRAIPSACKASAVIRKTCVSLLKLTSVNVVEYPARLEKCGR